MDATLRLVTDLTVVTVTAAAGGLLMRALRLPLVLGYVLAGLVVGPFTGGYVANTASLSGLGEIGLIFLVFSLGLDFSPGELRHIGTRPLVANLAVLGAIGLAAWAAGLALHLKHPITVALVIPVSSTAVGVALLGGMGIARGTIARISVTMLIAQDLLAVVALVLVSTPEAALSLGDLAIALARALLFVAIALLVGATLLQRAVKSAVAHVSSELLIPGFIALALAAAWLGHFAGLSLEFGAFLAGAVISEAAGSRIAGTIVAPFRELFVMLFFVSLGMLLDVHAVIGAWLTIAVAGVALVLFRGLTWFGAGKALALSAGGALALAVTLVPMGEFNMVLASAALAAHRLNGDEFALLAGMMFISILAGAGTTPLLRGRIDDRHVLPPSAPASGLADVVLLGYGRVGAIAAAQFRAAGLRTLVIEPEARAYERAVAAGHEALRQTGTDPLALDRALGSATRLVLTTIPDTHANVAIVRRLRAIGIPVVARALKDEDTAILREAGALEAISPETEGAHELARAALRAIEA